MVNPRLIQVTDTNTHGWANKHARWAAGDLDGCSRLPLPVLWPPVGFALLLAKESACGCCSNPAGVMVLELSRANIKSPVLTKSFHVSDLWEIFMCSPSVFSLDAEIPSLGFTIVSLGFLTTQYIRCFHLSHDFNTEIFSDSRQINTEEKCLFSLAFPLCPFLHKALWISKLSEN